MFFKVSKSLISCSCLKRLQDFFAYQCLVHFFFIYMLASFFCWLSTLYSWDNPKREHYIPNLLSNEELVPHLTFLMYLANFCWKCLDVKCHPYFSMSLNKMYLLVFNVFKYWWYLCLVVLWSFIRLSPYTLPYSYGNVTTIFIEELFLYYGF